MIPQISSEKPVNYKVPHERISHARIKPRPVTQNSYSTLPQANSWVNLNLLLVDPVRGS